MIETIKKRIEENRAEVAALQNRHNALVAQMQQNQNRFNQIIGAIAELELLLNHFEKDLNGQDESNLSSELNRL